MTTDLDVRVADAVFDAASSTPTSDAALDEILRRAESGRTGSAGRRVALVAASAGIAAVGVTAIVVLQPGRSEAPGTDEVTEAAATPTTLPTAGTVPGPLVYDDATLLSILYVNFDAGEAADQSRLFGSFADAEALAPCMHDRGFEHVASPPQSETSATDPRYVMPPTDFAAEYGFGVAAEALGILPPEFGPPDPNQRYYDSLSPSQQEANERALSDCLQELADRGEVVIPDQAWVAAADYAWEQIKPIVDNDDRVVEALATWRQCMAVAGFDYDDPAAIRSTFRPRVFDAVGFDTPVAEGSPEYAEIEQIMIEEITVATANAACVEPYTATLRAVILDRFDEYKAIFEAALEAGVESDAVGLS